MNVIIKNDPFQPLIKAFTNLYPDKQCTIEFTEDMPKLELSDLDDRDFEGIELNDDAEFGAAGATYFEEGQIPKILLDPNHLLTEVLNTLAEELVHVAVGYEAGHGEVFEREMARLYDEYNRIASSI